MKVSLILRQDPKELVIHGRDLDVDAAVWLTQNKRFVKKVLFPSLFARFEGHDVHRDDVRASVCRFAEGIVKRHLGDDAAFSFPAPKGALLLEKAKA